MPPRSNPAEHDFTNNGPGETGERGHAPGVIRLQPVSGPRQNLLNAIERIIEGNGSFRFLLLRDAPLDAQLLNQGDADLMGTRESVHALFRFLLPMAVAGDIHFRVTCQKAEKYQLTLYSRDLSDQAIFDLWIDLPQIDNGRRMIRMADLEPAVRFDGRAIGRLTPCLEGALFLQHLVAKKKSLTAPHTRRRLQAFTSHSCSDPRCRLSGLARDVLRSGRVSKGVLKESRRTLERRLHLHFEDPQHRPTTSRRRRMTGGALCVLGVDGVGKTSLIESLAAHPKLNATPVTGKRLYRRSWSYQLLTRRLKRSPEAGRERFDEHWCVPLYLRAVFSLTTRLTFRHKTAGPLIIDRCLADFLYRGRKRDNGSFHSRAEQLLRYGPALRTLHLVAEHRVTSARKPEITAAGHALYDLDLLQALTERVPCDHFVLFNGGSLEESAATAVQAVSRILELSLAPSSPALEIRPEPAEISLSKCA